ncbi:MaoC family dehydratase N-terminal domain-containing protein [bacterium]|nr:MaoC family dehydratase N-terminal domain-containing protein [bacterium]
MRREDRRADVRRYRRRQGTRREGVHGRQDHGDEPGRHDEVRHRIRHEEGPRAVVHFESKGGEDWTVKVQDGKCETVKGKAGSPTCVVKTDVETYAKVVAGELKAEQAFMQQKITASNLGDMMKFGRAFDMKKAAELAKSGGSPAPASSAPPAKPQGKGLNRSYVGNSYSGGHAWVKGEETKAYALATNDENPVYTDGKRSGGVVAPPLFAVKLGKDVLFKVVAEPGLNADLLRLVHGEQDMEFLRPLRPWDLCALRATITGVEEKSTGELLHVQLRLNVDGELAVRARSTMFIRGEKSGKKDDSPKKEEDESAGRKIAWKQVTEVTRDQSLRYAQASGDNNPIHTDESVAKMAGLPGVILQGLCTMAFAQKAVVDEVLKGDATRLKRLAVRFAKPVLMGDRLTTEGWEVERREGKTTYGFTVKNQSGVVVISNGIAEVAGA